MPTMSERIANAASNASWKLDQQLRLNNATKKGTEIGELLRKEKLRLADLVIDLAKQDNLSTETIKDTLAIIQNLLEQSDIILREIEKIKSEKSPEAMRQQTNNPTFETPPLETDSGLVCPKCHKNVPVKFCVYCGEEGVSQQSV